MNKQRTVITIETRQRTVVYKRRRAIAAWCDACAADVPMVTPDEAAAALQTSAREIFRLTQTGEIHYLETETGALLVCGNSLKTAQ